MGEQTIKARALVAHEVGARLKLQDIVLDISSLRSDEVLIRFSHSGICHTDVSVLNGAIPLEMPLIAGHEGAGVVEALPKDYKGDLNIGDTVLCSFTSCSQCDHCSVGAVAKCAAFAPSNFAGYRTDMSPVLAHLVSDGTPIHAGFFGQSSFASHSVVSARSIVKVDSKLPLELVCAFGCGIQTGFGTVLNKLVPSLTHRKDYSHLPHISELGVPVCSNSHGAGNARKYCLVVFGAGAVGIAAICAGKLSRDSIDRVVAVDLVDGRLDLAKKAGATHTINANGLSSDDVVARIKDCTADQQGANLVLEATGVPPVLENAIKSLALGGVVAVVGAPKAGSTVPLDIMNLLLSQTTVQGIIEGDSDPAVMVPYMVRLFERGGVFEVMKDLVKVYAPEDAEQALKDAATGRVVKPVIRWE